MDKEATLLAVRIECPNTDMALEYKPNELTFRFEEGGTGFVGIKKCNDCGEGHFICIPKDESY